MEIIVELRAGLLLLVDGRLTPDTRKGLIRVAQDEAGLTHFCWHERDASGKAAADPEKDIVIIPGESMFGKINRPGSRVFELRFPKEKHRNLFFWAQEPSAEEDEDYVAAVNLALNQGVAEEEDEGDAAEAMDAELAAPAEVEAAATAGGDGSAAGAGPIAASDLAAVLGSILSGQAVAGLQQRRRQAAVDLGPTLGDVLKPELLAPLLQSPDMVQRLAPFLPEEHRSAAAIAELVATPQFRHQLDLLSHALMTGQLDTQQFGLPPGGFGVLNFLQSIQRQADAEREQQQQQQQQDMAGGGGSTSGDAAGQPQ